MEQIEKSSDAQLAREIDVALPVKLSPAQQLTLVRSFVNIIGTWLSACSRITQ